MAVESALRGVATRPAPRRGRSSLFVRGCARVRRRALLRRLAEGADPRADAEASCCAAWLLSRRGHIALELKRRVLEAVEEPPTSSISAARLNREEVVEQAPRLLGLAVELRCGERVSVQGLALLERLLGDFESPLYVAAEPLGDAVDRAREALRPRGLGSS